MICPWLFHFNCSDLYLFMFTHCFVIICSELFEKCAFAYLLSSHAAHINHILEEYVVTISNVQNCCCARCIRIVQRCGVCCACQLSVYIYLYVNNELVYAYGHVICSSCTDKWLMNVRVCLHSFFISHFYADIFASSAGSFIINFDWNAIRWDSWKHPEVRWEWNRSNIHFIFVQYFVDNW